MSRVDNTEPLEVKGDNSLPNLNWKLLTKKRAGVTKGLPPGKKILPG